LLRKCVVAGIRDSSDSVRELIMGLPKKRVLF
jgi:hypothetical protein